MLDHLLSTEMDEVMHANDQLLLQRRKGNVFHGFREEPIKFRPTYKFDPNTDTYDSSAKSRLPSWTDRVLYKGKNCKYEDRRSIKCEQYDSVPAIKVSDHKPVFATFTVALDVGARQSQSTDAVQSEEDDDDEDEGTVTQKARPSSKRPTNSRVSSKQSSSVCSIS
eukprot:Colp12_sorted_trinity150504_noHs@33490